MLTANSLDAIGLSYAGTFTVPGPSGDVAILRFTLTGGTATALAVTQACSANITTVTTADSGSLGSTIFDAVDLTLTVGGTQLAFTVDSPPTTGFPSEVVLQDVVLTATTFSANSLSMPSFRTRATNC